MQNLFNDLAEVLQAEQAFISDGAILKNAVIEAALNMEPRLLELLMEGGLALGPPLLGEGHRDKPFGRLGLGRSRQATCCAGSCLG